MPAHQPNLLGLNDCQVWNTDLAFQHLRLNGHADTKRTTERRLHALALLPAALTPDGLTDDQSNPPTQLVLQWELEAARSKRKLVLFAQLFPLPGGQECLHANDARGGRYWVPLAASATQQSIAYALQNLQTHIGKDIAVFPHGRLVPIALQLAAIPLISLSLLGFSSALNLSAQSQHCAPARAPHLKHLEAESIHILREAVAQANNPVMLYTMDTNSSVMLRLAHKAFFPAPPPFKLLHIDTRWKFREMYRFRDHMAQASGMDLLVHINPDAIAKNINPFDHGPSLHTDITETAGQRQALDKYQFDVVFGGARPDVDRSGACIFSLRSAIHRGDPKNQRPELWSLCNTREAKGEFIHVSPLSNWTELDVWQYIYQESLPLVPLYFAKKRPVVVRHGMILLVDDDRFRLLSGEKIQARTVRFCTLGCYPLTSAVESKASTVSDIILELVDNRMKKSKRGTFKYG